MLIDLSSNILALYLLSILPLNSNCDSLSYEVTTFTYFSWGITAWDLLFDGGVTVLIGASQLEAGWSLWPLFLVALPERLAIRNCKELVGSDTTESVPYKLLLWVIFSDSVSPAFEDSLRSPAKRPPNLQKGSKFSIYFSTVIFFGPSALLWSCWTDFSPSKLLGLRSNGLLVVTFFEFSIRGTWKDVFYFNDC